MPPAVNSELGISEFGFRNWDFGFRNFSIAPNTSPNLVISTEGPLALSGEIYGMNRHHASFRIHRFLRSFASGFAQGASP
jgi:hypothetical protein